MEELNQTDISPEENIIIAEVQSRFLFTINIFYIALSETLKEVPMNINKKQTINSIFNFSHSPFIKATLEKKTKNPIDNSQLILFKNRLSINMRAILESFAKGHDNLVINYNDLYIIELVNVSQVDTDIIIELAAVDSLDTYATIKEIRNESRKNNY